MVAAESFAQIDCLADIDRFTGSASCTNSINAAGGRQIVNIHIYPFDFIHADTLSLEWGVLNLGDDRQRLINLELRQILPAGRHADLTFI